MLRPSKTKTPPSGARPGLQPGQSVARAISWKPDLESGAAGGERERLVQIRHQDTADAMDSLDRKRHQFVNFVKQKKNDIEGEEEAGSISGNNVPAQQKATSPTLDPHAATSSEMGIAPHAESLVGSNDVQYKLLARRKVKGGLLGRLDVVTADHSTVGEGLAGCWLPPIHLNKVINKFLHWTFRTSFLMLFVAFIIMFFVATGVFAGLILWSGHNNPQCIASAAFADWSDYPYSKRAADAYALSWTTFSTVGYGLIYPQVSTELPNQNPCIGLKFLCSVEAFLGVLFAGFCGAVLFAKVSRIQAHAQVLFSDPIVIRYGSGVEADDNDTSTAGGESADGEGGRGGGFLKPIPCPVLEFRIVNKLHSTLGGEIIEANLNVCASIDAEQVCPSILNATITQSRRRRKKKGHRRGDSRHLDVSLTNPALMASAITSSTVSDGLEASDARIANPSLVSAMTSHQEVVEDSSNLVARRIFSKLDIQPAYHPFFKRAWLARHVLDENSPLLTKKARKLVKNNSGFWPEELNNHAAVRNSVECDNILVSLSGTCNVNVATVFAHKTYDFVDVNVGYEFASVLQLRALWGPQG